MAVAWSLDKARHFVLGCEDLTVATDHKPLLKILGDRHLSDIKNPRLFNLKEKTLPFLFKIIHIPGKQHFTADAVSRYPSGEKDPERLVLQDDLHASAVAVEELDTESISAAVSVYEDEQSISAVAAASFEQKLISDAMVTLASLEVVSWDQVREATTSDPIMLMLADTIISGFPEHKQEVPEQLRSYFPHRNNLSTLDGVIMYDDRIIIPPKLRKHVSKTPPKLNKQVPKKLAG